MSVSELKVQLYNAIEAIDNKDFLEAVLTIVTSQKVNADYQITEEQLQILKERDVKFLKAESKTQSLDEFKIKNFSEKTSLMKYDEVAQLLKLTKRTLQNYVKDRKIPYLRLHGEVRFNPRQLANWLDAKTVKVRA